MQITDYIFAMIIAISISLIIILVFSTAEIYERLTIVEQQLLEIKTQQEGK